ncbi:MAG TPA: UDP-3-O-(3-hydroxymyristoyl)glucosamine N-acyltransferase [Vicinamibacterales bacterium]|nr:UDP-3-O-(3-hydroxymyristoyl)glucosamine N-acyltransferase [Vicinamibacterales bacterium]
MTLEELARRLECRLDGDGRADITRVAAIDEAGPGDLTFLANSKYTSRLASTRASAVLADDSVTSAPCPILRTPHVYLSLARAIAVLTPAAPPAPGISALAAVDPTADIGPDVSIAPFVVVGAGARIGARTILESHVAVGRAVAIGADCHVHPQVVLRDGVEIGQRVILHSGVVIGGDGFGFARRPDGGHEKIPQVARVVVEDDVEIGANSTVDRPAVGETRIGAGTKIDNLVMVAHGVRVGRNVLLAAQVGIAGSTTLEDGVTMAGQSGVVGHVRLGAGAIVGAKSAVTKDVGPGEHVTGVPALDVAAWRESAVLMRRLPEFREVLARLDARLRAIEAAVSGSPGTSDDRGTSGSR